ncbi:MAG: hypothetical protein ABIF19_12795 [Planctomycetota bacterium]
MFKKSISLMLLFAVGLTGTLSAGELIKINFQLAGAPVPEGYLPDTGLVFADRGNGYSYGWSQDMTDQTRDRNNAAAPDQRYDTLIHFRGRGAVWEIELAPGTYRIYIVCGDPSNADSNNQIELEGEVLADDPDGMDSFDEFEFIVTVTDGRLTWSEPAGSYVKPCFIEIESSRPVVKATQPDPKDGSMHFDTWVNLSWKAGQLAVSHDVYLSDSYDDVSAGAESTSRGNQTSTFYVAGFPGFAYPEGLVPGTTYYWRIDEVNDAEPNSPWKGDVWSFSIPPKTAYDPDPADGAEFVAADATLKWTPGFGAKLHTVYIGTEFDNVNNATGGAPQGAATYKPGTLELEKVYYWRVDEFDPPTTHKGDIWGFTTPGAAGNPQPSNGATGVQMTAKLGWTPATTAVSHDVYFGIDKDAVRNATTASPEYKGNKALGAESYDPGRLAWHSDYYWRVDAVYNAGPVKGLVWSFTTADFITVDDFESYNDIDPPDPASNRIFDKWIDGFGTTNNGALVGNDLPPYAEQTTVHGGAQSMPYAYDNNLKTSEATLTLVSGRDWTEEGVGKLSLWFRGAAANSAERMYVALNGTAVVYHDDPAVTNKGVWTQWVIDLQAFADQGVNLANVNTITIGLGTKNSPVAGGTGTMFFDDIRLYRP